MEQKQANKYGKFLGSKLFRFFVSRQLGDNQIKNLDNIYETFFKNSESPTFVEIGANDGRRVSNSIRLIFKNWRGFLVEPVPAIAEKAAHNFRYFDNVTIHNTAIGEPGRSTLRIHLADLLSTARPELFREYQGISWAKGMISRETIDVPCVTLDKFLTEQKIAPNFELLIIDVEGFEAQVLKGFQISVWRPQMIIIELSDIHPELKSLQKEHARLYLQVTKGDYIVIYKDLINTVFVRKELYLRRCVNDLKGS